MERLLRSILAGLVSRGTLEVVMASGSRFVLGDGTGAPSAIRFADARAQWAFLLDPELRFGELFMDGRLLVEKGSLYELFCLLMENDRRAPENRWLDAVDHVRFFLRRWKQRNDRRRARRNVVHHYDLDAELYD
ncbi:MAG: SAM-dependent methyltransferase, partial [Porticoccaceae bacterium]